MDLQRRLSVLSLLPAAAPGGKHAGSHFGPSLEEAVRAFQARRGLQVDGICGHQTWAALVEAGYCLGDRLLYRRSPMLRGDDVAQLQRQLGALGFDAGRVDGIFGDDTVRALVEFQRNVAVAPDGICGPVTLGELDRLRASRGQGTLVVGVREREELRQRPRTLAGRLVAVGHHGDLGATVELLCRALVGAGAEVVALLHPEGSRLAAQANRIGVEVYLGLQVTPATSSCRVAYYSGYRYESAGGRHLADLARGRLTTLAGIEDATSVGMSLPELRETRMPAAVCQLAPPSLVVEHGPELAQALLEAMVAWAGAPWD